MPNILQINNENLDKIIHLDRHFCVLCDASGIKASAIKSLAVQLLFDDELDVIEQRKKLIAKKEYIASRFLIKTLISRHFKISYHCIRLSFNDKLKKLQAIVNDKPLAINISLAHSKGMVFFSICTRATVIGVDIEYQNVDRDIISVAENFYHPNEYKALAKDQHATFYRLWTLKESLAKATGQSIFELLGQDTMQAIKGFHYTLGQYDDFQLATLQNGGLSAPPCYLLDLEKLLKNYDE